MTYQEALNYLNSLVNYEKKGSYSYSAAFKLDRMNHLVASLGDPHKAIRSIHVAGTKGKGSTCALTHSILTKAGFKTGLYTSPHLVSFRERIRIGDSLISEEAVAFIVGEVKAAADKLPGEQPTFFEAYTALAHLYFKSEKVDLAVYETGLGGRLDATNILESSVCAITPISYEHTHILGEKIEDIAAEKAGIIKNGSICVSAPQQDAALAVIEDACKNNEAKLILVGRDIRFEQKRSTDEREVFSVSGLFDTYDDLHMRLIGAHQVVNASTAIGIIEALRMNGITVGPEAVRRGIEAAKWPGRLELIKGSPRILLDGAQNGASAKALADSVKKVFKYRKLILVLGISNDKDVKAILKELIPIADSVVVTRSKIVERALAPEKIQELITPKSKDVVVTQSVKEALAKAVAKAAPQDLVLVTGSLFVVGEAQEIAYGSRRVD